MAGVTVASRLIFSPHLGRWPIKSAGNKASASDSLKLLLQLSADKLYSPEDKLSLTSVFMCVCARTCAHVCV